MPPLSDTHRRAALRGREFVARWRIQSGVWAARLFALFVGVTVLFPLLRQEGPDWLTAAVVLCLALGLLGGAELVRRGSRVAAVLLVVLYLGLKAVDVASGTPVWHGALVSLIVLGALLNGVWGTASLATVQRDALTVPPAPTPARPRVQRAAS